MSLRVGADRAWAALIALGAVQKSTGTDEDCHQGDYPSEDAVDDADHSAYPR